MDITTSKFTEWVKRESPKKNILGAVLTSLKRLRFFFHKMSLVSWPWFLNLKLINMRSGKIKVGFGPIVTGERTLANRKWHIDPVVNCMNRRSRRFVCDVFFHGDDLSKFDIIVSVKNFDDINPELVGEFKRRNKILLYDICDNPLGCKKSYLKEAWFIEALDGILINNPLQEKDLRHLNSNFKLIKLPVINRKHKKDYRKKNVVHILWEGYVENIEFTKNKINPILESLREEVDAKISMTYHSNIPTKNEGTIRYLEWKLSHWEEVLTNADIAVVVKPPDDVVQQRKPSTKVNTYRAAGLPVICAPSEADKLVVEDGKTGFIAYTDEDWRKYLKMLINSEELRGKIGRAGRKFVLENLGIERVAQEYMDFFEGLIAKKENRLS